MIEEKEKSISELTETIEVLLLLQILELKIKKLADTDDNIGIRFQDNMNAKYNVRIMKGKPDAKWQSQRQDYVKITSNGRVLGKDGLEIKSGKDGVKYPKSHPDAHISLNEYKNWNEWDKK